MPEIWEVDAIVIVSQFNQLKFIFFHKVIALKNNYEKCFMFHQNTLFLLVLEIFKFLYFCHIHCFTGWLKRNVKAYDIINGLNKNLITHFVWYLGKEKRYDIETLPIHTVLNKENSFLWKCHAENVHDRLVPDPLLNKPK